MDKSDPRHKQKGKSVGQVAIQRKYIHLALLVLVLVVIATGVFYLLHGKRTAAQSTAPIKTKGSVVASEPPRGFDLLKGGWRRPDGGYVFDISDIDASGHMVAAYFNPRPINVSRAEASMKGNAIKVFIELRDVNYPGATYNLTYDPQSNQLKGVYFQPALQQSFEVFFVRMK